MVARSAVRQAGPRLRAVLDPVIFGVVVVLAWMAFVRLTNIHPALLPGPDRVWAVLQGRLGFLARQMLQTLVIVFEGYAMGAVVGLLGGLGLAYSVWLRAAMQPVLVTLYVLPKAVLFPLFLLWFGVGPVARLLVTTLLVFFPVTENTLAGLRGVEREMLELSHSLQAREWTVFWKVRLPFSLPYIMTGLKIGLTEAFVGAVLTEVLAPVSGIGSRIIEASAFSNTAFILAGIVVIAVVGAACYFLVEFIERRLLFWYY